VDQQLSLRAVLIRRGRAGDPSTSRRGRRVAKWAGLGALVLFLVLGSLRFAHPLFPVQDEASCTVTSSSERDFTPRRGPDLFPTVGTDCGAFTAGDEVTCTADPSRSVLLTVGTAYDLAVRGPRIPVVSDPTVVSAQVSADQPTHSKPLSVPGGDAFHEDVEALTDRFSPQQLRAWDYEQPPYHRLCDAYRIVMTSEGLQLMAPARAAEMLLVPEGVSPREPRLPCEGWQCREH
jgi:hypothetical protein